MTYRKLGYLGIKRNPASGTIASGSLSLSQQEQAGVNPSSSPLLCSDGRFGESRPSTRTAGVSRPEIELEPGGIGFHDLRQTPILGDKRNPASGTIASGSLSLSQRELAGMNPSSR